MTPTLIAYFILAAALLFTYAVGGCLKAIHNVQAEIEPHAWLAEAEDLAWTEMERQP